MDYHKEWKKLIEGQTEETFDEFWKEYSDAEKTMYTMLLKDPKKKHEGTLKEFYELYKIDPIMFVGFLDGVISSLKNKQKVEGIKDDDKIKLDVDFEKLYRNMLEAEAEHLHTLAEWEDVLTPEERDLIYKEYRRSKTIIKDKTPGRNDPCPCGSGKKYKKCCGAN